MKTVAAFSKPEEAHLLRMRLEAAEIPAFILDEHLVQLDWLLSNAIGGVRVQVAEADLAAVRELLAADRAATQPREAPEVACPMCRAESVTPDELPRRLAFLSLLFLGFPFPFVRRRRWRCQACKHAW